MSKNPTPEPKEQKSPRWRLEPTPIGGRPAVLEKKHVPDYPTRRQPAASTPRRWSYEALRHAHISTPVTGDLRTLDLTRIGSVYLPCVIPRYGEGELQIAGPSPFDLAEWLYGPVARFSWFADRYPARARKVCRLFVAFIDFDARRREWMQPHLSGATADRVARRRRRQIALEGHRAERRLRAAAAYGLRTRLGTHLAAANEGAWLHLHVRLSKLPDGIRVCEQCALVFEGTRRGRRCPGCRQSSVRIALHPEYAGGQHVEVAVRPAPDNPDRFATLYRLQCAHCGVETVRESSTARFCRNCGDGAGRVRRHRKSSTRVGSRRHCFIHADGAPEFAVSGVPGHPDPLYSVDGVIQTTDLEAAHFLDQLPTVRRAPAHDGDTPGNALTPG